MKKTCLLLRNNISTRFSEREEQGTKSCKEITSLILAWTPGYMPDIFLALS
jgi:hypothetical protein